MQTQQHMVVLRLPEDLAKRMRELIKEGQALEFAEQGDGGGPGARSGQYLDVRPHEYGNADGDKFVFSMEGKDYPALLGNLPSIVEVQKTFDQKTFLKSGDVGQMLRVFHTDEEMRQAKSKLRPNSSGLYLPEGAGAPAIDSVMVSGITPPTHNIVKRRYEMTRPKKAPPVHEVSAVVEEIGRGWRVKSLEDTELDCIEYVEEDVVDFEEWMVDDERPNGITVVISNKKDLNAADPAKIFTSRPYVVFKAADLKSGSRQNATSGGAAPELDTEAAAGLLGKNTMSMDSLVDTGASSAAVSDSGGEGLGKMDDSDGKGAGEDDEEDEEDDDDDDWMIEEDEEEGEGEGEGMGEGEGEGVEEGQGEGVGEGEEERVDADEASEAGEEAGEEADEEAGEEADEEAGEASAGEGQGGVVDGGEFQQDRD